jgi:hypothetical protein
MNQPKQIWMANRMPSNENYCDDPVNFEQPKSRKRLPGVLALIAALVVGTFVIQTTLAANISINSGPVEFGQGITQTVACDDDILVTPISTFVNASGGGSFYFSSIAVTNVSSSCNGKDLTVRAYGNTSSTPLALFNSTSTSAVIHKNNGGTFEAGVGTAGATVSSGSETFTVSFTSPVALASAVFKITLESGAHTRIAYNVGDTGPGGGIVFYYSAAGFNCGSGFSATGSPTGGKCNYLEAAPTSGSNAWTDTKYIWSEDTYGRTGATATAIGSGYANTSTIISREGGRTNSAAFVSRAYRGPNNLSDWYLPSYDELGALYSERVRVGVRYSADGDNYWTSSDEVSGGLYPYYLMMNFPFWTSNPKSESYYVRPIRAF